MEESEIQSVQHEVESYRSSQASAILNAIELNKPLKANDLLNNFNLTTNLERSFSLIICSAHTFPKV